MFSLHLISFFFFDWRRVTGRKSFADLQDVIISQRIPQRSLGITLTRILVLRLCLVGQNLSESQFLDLWNEGTVPCISEQWRDKMTVCMGSNDHRLHPSVGNGYFHCQQNGHHHHQCHRHHQQWPLGPHRKDINSCLLTSRHPANTSQHIRFFWHHTGTRWWSARGLHSVFSSMTSPADSAGAPS